MQVLYDYNRCFYLLSVKKSHLLSPRNGCKCLLGNVLRVSFGFGISSFFMVRKYSVSFVLHASNFVDSFAGRFCNNTSAGYEHCGMVNKKTPFIDSFTSPLR